MEGGGVTSGAPTPCPGTHALASAPASPPRRLMHPLPPRPLERSKILFQCRARTAPEPTIADILAACVACAPPRPPLLAKPPPALQQEEAPVPLVGHAPLATTGLRPAAAFLPLVGARAEGCGGGGGAVTMGGGMGGGDDADEDDDF